MLHLSFNFWAGDYQIKHILMSMVCDDCPSIYMKFSFLYIQFYKYLLLVKCLHSVMTSCQNKDMWSDCYSTSKHRKSLPFKYGLTTTTTHAFVKHCRRNRTNICRRKEMITRIQNMNNVPYFPAAQHGTFPTQPFFPARRYLFPQ